MSAATQLPADLVSPDSRCCSGNIWRKKDKSQDEFTVGDWQLCFKCPCVWDFITLFLCVDAKIDTPALIKDYHDELCKVRPDVAEGYPLEQMVKDTAVGFTCFWLLVIPVFAGVVVADLPPDKAEFTFKSYIGPVYINCMAIQDQYQVDKLCRQVLAGEFK